MKRIAFVLACSILVFFGCFPFWWEPEAQDPKDSGGLDYQVEIDWMPNLGCEALDYNEAHVMYDGNGRHDRFPLVSGSLPVDAPRWKACTKPLQEFELLDRVVAGLVLELAVMKDTLLVGEPVVAEARVTNVTDEDVFDPLLFESADRRLRVYVVHSESTAIDLDTGIRRMRAGADWLRVPPGVTAKTVFTLGNLDIMYSGIGRGFAVPHSYLSNPGWYRLFATYGRAVASDGHGPQGGTIISNTDSFFVKSPVGDDAVVYESMGADMVVEVSMPTLKGLYTEHDSSVYAPYLMAVYAHSLGGYPKEYQGYSQCAAALQGLVAKYPDHVLKELVEFDIAISMGRAREDAEANRRLDELQRLYPKNVKGYIRFDATGSMVQPYGMIIGGRRGEVRDDTD